jgi:energy-coupling factor transporter ATP-binding protein EcfA2
MSAALQIRNLSYQYGNSQMVLDRVSLEVSQGENLVIFGPNGSGKTTLLLHINGILTGRGSVSVGGLELSPKTLTEIRRKVGIVFQDADEQLFMPTVLDDVMFGLLNSGWQQDRAQEQAGRFLNQVGISEALFQRVPYHLSAGEKRRVALAGVLVMEPELLLLDEPTTSLDPPGQRSLVQLLQVLKQTMIIATHDIHFAQALSRRAIFLQEGRIIADGPIERVVNQFGWNAYD